MFVLKNKLTVGFLIYCLQEWKKKIDLIMLINVQNLISHSVTNFEPEWQARMQLNL